MVAGGHKNDYRGIRALICHKASIQTGLFTRLDSIQILDCKMSVKSHRFCLVLLCLPKQWKHGYRQSLAR